MEEPIRILHVFGRMNRGGAESRTMDIYRNIDRSKVQFDFVVHTSDACLFDEEIQCLGGKVFSMPQFKGKNYFAYKKAWDLFFKKYSEYKIVHGHMTSTAFVYLNVAKKHNLPVRIAHSRNAKSTSASRYWLTKLARLYCTHMFAVSELAALAEFGKQNVEDKRVNIIPNGIDSKVYRYNTKIRAEVRSELNLNDETLVGHVGRFNEAKNHAFLLAIFAKFKTHDNKAKLLLVGEGNLRNDVEEKAKRLNVFDDVIFLGVRDDVGRLLQAMDILLFPSLYEGLPGVVLESQAAGLPCVISDEITTEAKITDLVTYLPLSNTIELWAEELLGKLSGFERKDTHQQIVDSGFDIVSVAKWYEQFYLKSLAYDS